MLYIDIFSEPNIEEALNMLGTYRDKIDDFIMFPDFNRIIPNLQWAVLNFENPTIGKYYHLYTKSGSRAFTLKIDPLSISWIDRETLRLNGYNANFKVINGKIHPISDELSAERLLSLFQKLFT